jgi:HPt (histidine-containing phosphotransfer) domain-containing protein
MDDYLSKPFKQSDLRELIERWLGANPPPRAGEDSVETETHDEAAEQLINESALDEIRSLQSPRRPTLLADLIRSFFDSSEGLIEDLRNAFEAGDAAAVREAAHALKSSSGNVGARAVSKLAFELESHARADDLSHSKSVLDNLDEVYARSKVALEREVG